MNRYSFITFPRKKGYAFNLLTRLLFLSVLCLTLSSYGFGDLTDINNENSSAATASKCGGGHAHAFTSHAFKLQSNHYTDQDCLFGADKGILPEGATVHDVRGCDHFFLQREKEVCQIMESFILKG